MADCKNQIAQRLTKYLKRCTDILPNEFVTQDSNRLLVLSFGVSGLSIIDALDDIDKEEFIEFIYTHQILPKDKNDKECGFRGSSAIGCSSDPEKVKVDRCSYDCTHSTMVYVSLSMLILLGDDLSRIDKKAVASAIASLECPDEPGLFMANVLSLERDVRFVFSSVTSCYILGQLNVLNLDSIMNFIIRCQTYEGGFGTIPGLEAHAGATYCALASLAIIGRLDCVLGADSNRRDRLIKWLVRLQDVGIHGRIGKKDDTCYTFWVCASLKILKCPELVDKKSVLLFVTTCWDDILGAIKKCPSFTPDPLHTCLCLSGLSCLCDRVDEGSTSRFDVPDYIDIGNKDNIVLNMKEIAWYQAFKQMVNSNQFKLINPELNMPQYSVDRLHQIHRSWTGDS